MEKIDKKLFERIENSNEEAEKITAKSIPFWTQVKINLFKNKGSVFGLITIFLISLLAIIGPWFGPNVDISKERTSASTHQVFGYEVPSLITSFITCSEKCGSNTQILEHQNLPPKIKYLDQYGPFGLFDGKKGVRIPIIWRINPNYTEGYDFYAAADIPEDVYYTFGTDNIGRDIWTRVWVGVRVSLFIAIVAAIIDIFIGAIYGSVSGFFGGKTDIYMQRITEVLIGIPSLVILTLLILVLDPGIFPIIIAIALTGWIGMSRVVRGQILKTKEQEFVMASRTLGASNIRLVTKHLIPNVIGSIVVMLMFTIPSAIFYEAFLSIIGLGVPVPQASLGSLIDGGYETMLVYPYQLIIPALILSLLMLGFNLLADGLRDALDPKLRK